MKKLFYFLGIVLFSMTILLACSTNLNSRVKRNLSEESRLLFSAQSDTFFATLTFGEREEPYIFNGISNEKVQFAVLSVSYSQRRAQTVEATVTINGIEHNAVLEQHAITRNFLADLETIIDEDDDISIEIENEQADFSCASKNFETNYQQALSLAIKELQNDTEMLLNDKSNKFEAYLKIVNNPSQDPNVFYWYFILRLSTGESFVVMVDTMSDTIVGRF